MYECPGEYYYRFGDAVIELRGYGSSNPFNREKHPQPDEFINVYKGSQRLLQHGIPYRDIYKNSMADLLRANRIAMLVRKVNRSHHYLCFVNRLCTSFRFGSLEENRFRCFIFILDLRSPCHAEIRLRLLSLLDKKPDIKKSRRRPESAGGLVPIPYPTIIRRISETVTPKMLILWITSSSSRRPYRRCRCQNCNDNGHKEDFHRESFTNTPISNAVQLYVSMRYETTFLEKTIFKECYVTDQDINLMGLDWIDELNLIQSPDKNETCQTSTLEPMNAENLVRGCNQCLHVAKIPHPSIHIQSSKLDSHRTQL
ncbi:hypothetical protein ACTXT7_000461 [Hymenolepis weldensis]